MDIATNLRYEATGEYGTMPPVRYIPLMLSAANEIDDLNRHIAKSEADYVEHAVHALHELDKEMANSDRLADALHLLTEARGVPSNLIDVVFDAIEQHDKMRHNHRNNTENQRNNQEMDEN